MATRRLVVGSNALVCQETTLLGDITIGSGCVLHPKCTINAEAGPILIGKNNVFEENSIIYNSCSTPLLIGDENIFEVGCHIEGTRVGNQNVFEANSKVNGTTMVGNNCVVGIGCATEFAEHLADGTVIYGYEQSRRVQTSRDVMQIILHAKHMEYLREILPKYHHMRPIQG